MKAGKAVYGQMERIYQLFQLINGSFSRVAKFYKNRRRDFGGRAENVREFWSCARIRLLDDFFRNAGDNARE